jgi:hypothetical protein
MTTHNTAVAQYFTVRCTFIMLADGAGPAVVGSRLTST